MSIDNNPFADFAEQQLPQNEADYDLSENVLEDVVRYSRGCIIGNEQQSLITLLCWLSGWMAEEDDYVNNVIIGTSSSGKTHINRNMKALMPDDDVFGTTSTSDKGMIDADEWNDKRVAIMSEWQKLSSSTQEFFKSVAGDDGGYSYDRSKGGSDDGNSDGSAGTETIEQKAMPYSFTYAQFSMDHEMWTRLFKIYVDESKYVNVATAKKHHDREHIQLADELDHEYITDVSRIRSALSAHIATLPTEFRAHMPEWVYDAMSPIYDLSRGASKRYTASISNLVRCSCLLNHHNRATREMTKDGETHTYHIIEPQDIVNILACREVLLGTTHRLEPRKFKIIEAIEFKNSMGTQAICTIEEIQEYLQSEQSDMSRIGRGYIVELLGELQEEFMVSVHENYDDRKNGYELLSLQSIGYPDLVGFDQIDYHTNDPFMELGGGTPAEPFSACVDPIRDQPIAVTVEESRKRFSRVEDALDGSLSVADAMGPSSASSDTSTEPMTHTTTVDTSSTNDDGGDTLPSYTDQPQTPTIDDPVTATVYEHCKETVDGELWPMAKTGHEYFTGVVDTETTLSMTETTDTLFDPEHPIWDQPDKPASWVATQGEADGEIEMALDELLSMDVFTFETSDDDDDIDDEHVRVTVNEVAIDV